MRGLYIGRYNPFHLGHYNTLKKIEAMDIIDEMMIVVGSSLSSYEPRNPMTCGERIDMIEQAVEGAYDFKTKVYGISDIQYNAVWVHHIVAQLPKFDIVFANNPLVIRLFRDAGYRVECIEMTDRSLYSSTEIRKLICANNDSWQYKVPPIIYRFMIDNDLTERIIEINKTDEV